MPLTPEFLAESYGVELQMHSDIPRNQAAMAGNTVFLGEFDDQELRLCAFLHEVGHMRTGSTLSKIVNEAAAWDWAFREAGWLGLSWGYDHRCAKYARECLASYLGGQYDDLKQHYVNRLIETEVNI